MDLIPLPPHSLHIGQVLGFSIRDARGKLLFASGQVLPNTPQVHALIQRGAFVLAHETKEYQKALAHKVDTMMHQGATLGSIADAKADYRPESLLKKHSIRFADQAAWTDLLLHVHTLLREPRAEDFLPRFEQYLQEVMTRVQQNADAMLMMLVYDASHDYQQYSAKHGLLCLLVAELCARQLGWSEEWRVSLIRAALSMNIAISELQDRLCARDEELSDSQRAEIRQRIDHAPQLLRELGVKDELWLQILMLRQEAGPGPMAGRGPAEQMARLLRRVNIFAARLSPRRSRKAMSATAAARAAYLDELGQPDEAGAALIKAVGLYPPGSLVRLANSEHCVVLKRGHSANEPLVAALIGKSGNPLSEPVPRDTRLAAQAVAASLAPHELRVLVNMEKVLRLY
ncbi:HD domain-containing phosphohydrolase [Pelomonas sp. SE-A7]|uniref:HD domain-containing phosphohydrolase n=1 Tax=Pelomonas sp. SE-A7 TaxID=3054953 RepID=UPI00259C8D26|nr:HD domain-containing phosphohydrolase [Pelomonas sp. SE-A7]MDM4768253.1 hypothetical protein [Pelomonas sp. SE-A7]